MSQFLDKISAMTRERVATLRSELPLPEMKRQLRDLESPRSFQKSIRQVRRVSLIAELKQASPSAGEIRIEKDIVSRIEDYSEGGAAALSILTEPDYFKGSPTFLGVVRRHTPLPLLRKDFVVDAWQLYESRLLGADAVLLIVAILKFSLSDFLSQAQEAGIETLVEIHDESELEIALDAGAMTIGINNRNLQSLVVDPKTAERLAPLVPKDRTIVIESGVRTPNEMKRFGQWGAHAALVGETLMRAEHPKKLVKEFVEAGHL